MARLLLQATGEIESSSWQNLVGKTDCIKGNVKITYEENDERISRVHYCVWCQRQRPDVH